MKIEIINQNKYKIYFDEKDLSDKNISVESFLSDNSSANIFINHILTIISDSLKINCKNCHFYYNLISIDFKNFVIFLIRKSQISTEIFIKKRYKSTAFNKYSIIYQTSNFNDLIDTCNYIKNSLNIEFIESNFYNQNNIYILQLKIKLKKEYKKAKNLLKEVNFTKKVYNFNKKAEAKLIYKNNAIQML